VTVDPPDPLPADTEDPWTAAPRPSPDLPIAPPLTPPGTGSEPPIDTAGADPMLASPEPFAPTVPAPALVSSRALLGASFELLTRTGADLRRASFYIGGIVLGTAGPAALAVWALDVVGIDLEDPSFGEVGSGVVGPTAGAAIGLSFLILLAGLGVIVAAVESRTLAMGILGGVVAGRPVTLRQAVARSRRTFWLAILAGILVGIPVLVVQGVIGAALGGSSTANEQFELPTSTVVSALVGAPIAYVLAGVVLGGVGPVEGLRRSIRLFNARRSSAVIVAGFETVTALLLLLGLGAGLDLVARFVGVLGLGPTSGPLGLAIVTMLIVAGMFAVGTLVFTVYALTIAPQVVMFVGLTHATYGLDTVRPGGRDDPDAAPRPGTWRFRWYPRAMLLGFVLGGIGLAAVVASLTA
jgi:hypothetical protein